MKRQKTVTWLVCVWTAGVLAAPAAAQTDFSQFPLTKALPPGSFIAVAAKANPEQAFLDEYWSGVTQAFLDSGILTDVWDLITDNLPEDKIEEVEETRERFSELLEKVEWGQLFHREMIYAGRFSSAITGGSPYEGLLIGRMKDKKQAAANCQQIRAILEEIRKLVETRVEEGSVVIQEVKIEGVEFTQFGPSVMPNLFWVGQHDELIILALFNQSILQDSLGLLKGTSKKPGLASSERFKKAFAQLPAAEDSLMFFDVGDLLAKLDLMLKAASGLSATTQPAGGSEQDNPLAWVRLVSALLDDLQIVDHIASVEWTDGYRVFTDTLTAVKPEARSKPLFKVLTSGRPLEKFEQYIPREATGFSCSSGIGLSALYRYLLGFVADNVPGGKGMVEEFERMQKEDWELNIDQDILRFFSGPSFSASMGDDWVFMMQVSDEQKAREQLDKMMKRVNTLLGEQNALMITEVTIGGQEGFQQITHPMMMMMGGLKPPVVGFAQGLMLVGSSAGGVEKVLKTGEGKHPNITKSKRWQQEALAPKGAVTSISFTDETNKAAELQSMIGGLSMALGMVGLFAQDMPPEARSLFSSLPPLLSKLSPVVGKLDFYQSSAEYSTFDGDQWRTKAVQNYKKPRPKPAVKEGDEEGDDKGGSEDQE